MISAQGDLNAEQANGANTSDRPELTGVNQVAGSTDTWDLNYDQAVVAVPANLTRFRAYAEDGQGSYSATAATVQPNLTTVRVTFPVSAFTTKVVGIADQGSTTGDGGTPSGPVQSAAAPAGTTRPSTASYIGIRTANNAPGFTDAPDLRQVSVDTVNDRATYRFDQVVNPGTIGAATTFGLYRKLPLAGGPEPGQRTVDRSADGGNA